ncbi:unnamed protein product [Brachionus calyciflorus]|uniref:Reverse transcriptase Ty1/copia-type domain-containing protein n=1 Tax=Brachionus calyciflorus TaxID=104777 RepID=A0A813XPC5_9BILA|nr:unnamed protein product [Brachionus calyciflorus]
MIGYGESEGIYWIYDKKNHKAFRSRDIRYNENKILDNEGQETNELNLSRTINSEQIKEEINEDDNDDNKETGNGSDRENNSNENNSNNSNKNENNSNLLTVPRKSNRISRPPDRYNPDDYSSQTSYFLEYLSLFESDENNEEPTTFDEAINSPMKENCKEAIKSEINSFEENDVWSKAELPDGMKTIKTKWVFKIKRNAKNEPLRYKARLVAKGYDQEMENGIIKKPLHQQVIGSLIYLMISTRPDISYSVSVLSRNMQMSRELLWRYLKRLLRYVKTTKNYSLVYQRDKTKEIELIGYSDADYAGNIEDRKSTSGYVFKYKNCPVSWNCSEQKVVSLSSTESEYIALKLAVKEGLWLNQLLNDLNLSTGKAKIFGDNKSTICLTKNLEFHSRSKHIDIRYHFVREKINERLLDIGYLPT